MEAAVDDDAVTRLDRKLVPGLAKRRKHADLDARADRCVLPTSVADIDFLHIEANDVPIG